ncbi:aldo/keto reductase [Ruania alba]|uniref:D-threo-aldose 1-dehydrogenase n=1 Tax=Ruania alba TaxID=648782 RepID=A0A1H5E3G4_9MICO|nr:aldo/keto reductase [Ruania alba]SED85688.1 D-threo-aldose 1-dehydrogenase [Ruania alba]
MSTPAAPVDLRDLGRSGLSVSPITLGTSSLGRDVSPGAAAEPEAVSLAAAMLHGPYAVVDTSNVYAGGHSERVLGLALADTGIAPGRQIVTKVDADPETGVFDRDRVLRSFEESLTRLGIDRVGLLHLHDPYGVPFEDAMGPGGAVEGLLELRESGAVDAIGIAAGKVSVVSRYVASDCFDVLLTHNRYTLLERRATVLLEAAKERGMGVFNAAPFGGALLARGSASGATYAYRETPAEVLERVRLLEEICARHGVELATAALHFSLRSPLVDSTVVGISRPERIADLEARRQHAVPDELWADIDALGPPPAAVAD